MEDMDGFIHPPDFYSMKKMESKYGKNGVDAFFDFSCFPSTKNGRFCTEMRAFLSQRRDESMGF
jgi:hypothetical protein